MKTSYQLFAVMLCLACVAGKSQNILDMNATPAQPQNATTQASGKSGYFGFSGGVVMPTQKYFMDANTVLGGYAMVGASINFSYGITPKHFPVGLALEGGYYFNRYDLQGYLDSKQSAEGPVYGTDEPNANKLFYRGFYGMAGLYKEFSFGRTCLGVHALAGDFMVSTPDVSYYAVERSASSSQPNSSLWDISPEKGSAVGYDLGISTRIKGTAHINFFINLDYFYSDIPVTYAVLYTNYNGSTPPSSTASYEMPRNTYNGNAAFSNDMPYQYNYSAPKTGNNYYVPLNGSNGGNQRGLNSDNVLVQFLSLSVGVGFGFGK